MFSIVEKRRLYFTISGIVIGLGLAIMLYSFVTTGSPFLLGIDFIGGSIYDIGFTEEGATESNVRSTFTEFGHDNTIIQQLGDPTEHRWSVRSSEFQGAESSQPLIDALSQIAPVDRDSLRIEQVSPTIGREVAQAAFLAVLVAAVIITGFIVIAFRQVPNAFRYGVCAIAAMLHDILVVSGVAALTGLLFGWEVDALFLTAVLTIVGFSVQDTIVLFDRIRENIPKHIGEPYETIVNRSILETMHRSLATQLNAFFIMVAILLFGGGAIRQFIAILFLGLLSGTYSSIFIAVPLLVAWEQGEIPFLKGGAGLDDDADEELTPARARG
jgi:preprotein translocase SecF subunit